MSPSILKQELSQPPRQLVLAYIEDHPKTIMVLRTARKRAEERGCKWCAVYVETPARAGSADEGAHERMLRQLTLASQMGGKAIQLEGETLDDVLGKLLEAEKGHLALCLVGSTESEPGWRIWRRYRASSWQRAVKIMSKYTSVETVPLTGQPFVRNLWPRLQLRSVRFSHLGYALLAVAVAFACAQLLQWLLPPALFRINTRNIGLLFMIACAFSASRFGLLPGLLASAAGFVAANYYFVPSYRLPQLSNITEVLDMTLFLSAAVLISLFTSQTRGLAERSARREMSTQALFTLYRIAASAFTRSQALEQLQRKLTRMLEMDVAFFLPPVLNPERIEPAFPADLALDEGDRKALETCWKEVKTTGIASPFNPGGHWRFEPMMAPGGEIGVLGVRPSKRRLDVWYGRLLSAIADQTGSILEHIEMERSMEATRIREEREKLRAMLLSSVSHDLKTPLAGIIGALSVHQSLGDRLPPARRTDLMETALEEAHRLDSFITNILDMTRLESGNVEFHQEWHDMEGILQQISKRLQHRLRRHPLNIHPLPTGIEIFMDVMLIEQVLQNLVDNACKYTPADTPIEIICRTDPRGYLVEVRDHGPGIPAGKLTEIFDKYARLQKEDTQVAGTGLGLAICRSVMDAQQGWITAANHEDGGAVFTICLPQWRKIEMVKQDVRKKKVAV